MFACDVEFVSIFPYVCRGQWSDHENDHLLIFYQLASIWLSNFDMVPYSNDKCVEYSFGTNGASFSSVRAIWISFSTRWRPISKISSVTSVQKCLVWFDSSYVSHLEIIAISFSAIGNTTLVFINLHFIMKAQTNTIVYYFDFTVPHFDFTYILVPHLY